MTPRTLVILPTFNERPNLAAVVSGIRRAGFDVLVIDDASQDGTGELADALAAEDPAVGVLHRPRKLGLGSAYVAGFGHGLDRDYDFLVEMDADGSHPVDRLGALVDAATRSGGLAIGSRYRQGGSVVGWGWRRQLLSRGANAYCRTLLGVGVHDATSGFRCFPRGVLESLDAATVISDGYGFQIEMVYRCVQLGHCIVEVPIRFEDRLAGRSKVSKGEIARALALVPRLRLHSLLRHGTALRRPGRAGSAGTGLRSSLD